ncbi:uncharacterized protein K452DRAFT_293326 [Aplosporella prunicola CBS 121167]|uniref:REM-1 domain-containing protein n=1 Tax=Aplosporella prunicola CBS 121167 TaxID=1176127 RepID=A0A6A6ATK1_9PEZI|nr:uncharacterized protein K452DRAFT_293326 [Aplosporella prunicola CBS 121167]KAF2135299.1 hypothetical protein K452DRAFT_293326 [Aplosporella prunicola CBS 121167]
METKNLSIDQFCRAMTSLKRSQESIGRSRENQRLLQRAIEDMKRGEKAVRARVETVRKRGTWDAELVAMLEELQNLQEVIEGFA